MGVASTLNGLGVLVTRPEHQAENLCRMIERHGGVAIRWPALIIVEPRDPAPALALFERLADYDLAIFTSANAVDRALPAIRKRGGIPDRLDIAAVGRASGRALARHGIDRCLQPGDDFSSEGLLALPRLRDVTGQRIVIVRGEDGRELLAETLSARGARVDRAEVYRRERPAAGDIETLLVRWKRGEIGAVTVTSGENLRNLFDMLGVAGQDYLRDTPLIVVSPRIRQIAAEYGCRHLLLARDAGDDAIAAALLDLTTTALSPVR
ncbi:MAG: uroporphyrinogen-III synthase [Candidatus Competibacter sp.]|nr:uroporphyrinogen-III synthase [Candidatus Competibacter sp.]MDG4583054.1 uroporphyrinogen-III synthase [Candidatus Competibacter sp.]